MKHGGRSVLGCVWKNGVGGGEARRAVIRSTKSAVECTGNGRKETCRQAVVILQHENMRPNATELGFHDSTSLLVQQPERSTIYLWRSLGYMPVKAGANSSAFLYVVDGIFSHSGRAHTLSRRLCHPSRPEKPQ